MSKAATNGGHAYTVMFDGDYLSNGAQPKLNVVVSATAAELGYALLSATRAEVTVVSDVTVSAGALAEVATVITAGEGALEGDYGVIAANGSHLIHVTAAPGSTRVATSAYCRGIVNRGDVIYIAGERHVADLDEDADLDDDGAYAGFGSKNATLYRRRTVVAFDATAAARPTSRLRSRRCRASARST